RAASAGPVIAARPGSTRPAPPGRLRRARARLGSRLGAIPLRVTLVLALVVSAGLGLLVSGTVVTSALEKSLLGRTDQQLRDAVAPRPRPRPSTPPPPSDPRTPPSPFYLVVESDWENGSFVLRPFDVDA